MTSTPFQPHRAQPPIASLRPIHLLLTIQSIVVILLSVNRLSSFTTGYVAANEFLRWVDFHNLVTLPLISLSAFYLLKRQLEGTDRERRGWRYHTVGLLFILGIYLFGAGYGAHEVTNYLHIRFCPAETTDDLCRIVIFNDDAFSHWIWFAGFVLINAMLLCTQALFPQAAPVGRSDSALLIGNALFIALGIFANLAFETIGLDLYVVALLALLAIVLWWCQGRQPLFIYYSTAYWLGLAATALYKLWT